MSYRPSRFWPQMILAACLLLGLGDAGAQAQTPAPDANTVAVWPNAQSKANSDDWIRLHHTQIKQMQPRLLVLNFVNGLSQEEAARKVEAVIAVARESSRWHGYAKRDAPVFLDYKVFKIVDLTDPAPLPEDIRYEGNSSKYPRTPDWKPGQTNLQYGQLFEAKFARYMGIPDPNDSTRMLTLPEMVNRGVVHEVWFLANQGKFGGPLECTEYKQAYDDNLRKVAGRAIQAGSQASDQQPFFGRSLRILHLNPERGPGEALTALGRALENTARVGAVPYLSHYYAEYAGFDLKKHFHLPFDSLYAREGTELDYPEEGVLAYVWKGERRTLRPYVPVGGNVAFMPSARRDYDLQNQQSVLSTIEHYRLYDGPDGKDRVTPWTNARFARYSGLAQGGVGPWMVYWRQNMPGLDNACKDDNGRPMLNWWPFLFY